MKYKISFTLRLLVAIILLQSLYFKFGSHEQAIHVFSTLGVEPWGRFLLGGIELVLAIAILLPTTKSIANTLTGLLMIGAVGAHLFTPLGIVVRWNGQNDGGQLFIMGVAVIILCVIEMGIEKSNA
ncbi:MAG: DoxX family protein [Flavobacteriaceae bacterium]|nr:DoxX family protein [Flavobacteriaceae bacterium]